jgi:hypothetical protein
LGTTFTMKVHLQVNGSPAGLADLVAAVQRIPALR